MRLLRWLTWHILLLPADLLFILASVAMAVLVWVLTPLRLAKLLRRRRRGEAVDWRELLWKPRMALSFVGFTLESVVMAHSVRIGEV